MRQRLTAVLLAAVLCAALIALPGAAEGYEVTSVSLNGDIVFNTETAILAWRGPGETYYTLLDPAGSALSEAIYREVDYDYTLTGCLRVTIDAPDGVHGQGIVDSSGREVIPARYAWIDGFSSRWQAGLVVKEDPESRDYMLYDSVRGERRGFTLDHADIYFDGALVGTLDAEAYGSGEGKAKGAYLSLKDAGGVVRTYDRALTPSPITGEYIYGEYERDYNYENGGYTNIHMGTGQQAFAPDCTLTPDEVDEPIMADDGKIYDLQGNVLAIIAGEDMYTSIDEVSNGYAVIYCDGKYGLIDLQGRLLLPMEYDSIGSYEDNMLGYGYIVIEKDDHCGIADQRGDVTVPCVYTRRAEKRGNMMVIQNIDGTYTVVTGAAGELEGSFDAVNGDWEGCSAFAVRRGDQWAVLDVYGRTIIDFTEARSMSVSADGSMAVAWVGDDGRVLYGITPKQAAVQPASDTWICENCHTENAGRFCVECGSPRPTADAGSVVCPGCGTIYAPDQAPRFCPECGTKLGA